MIRGGKRAIRAKRFAEAAFVFVTPLLVRADAGPGILRWKFQVGDQREYVLERTVLGKAEIDGSQVEFAMSLTLELAGKVEALRANGDAEISQAVRNVKLELKSPVGGNLTYDSRMGSEPREHLSWPRIGPRIAALRAEPARLVVSPLGRVLELRLPVGLAGEAEPPVPEDEDRTLGASGFSEESVGNLLKRAFVPLPSAPITVGLSWTDQFEMKLGEFGTQKTTWEYSLAREAAAPGANAGPETKAIVRLEARSRVAIEPAPGPAAGARVEIREQKGVGSVLFDVALGRARSQEFDQKIVLVVTVNDNPFVQEVRDMVKVTRREGGGAP